MAASAVYLGRDFTMSAINPSTWLEILEETKWETHPMENGPAAVKWGDFGTNTGQHISSEVYRGEQKKWS